MGGIYSTIFLGSSNSNSNCNQTQQTLCCSLKSAEAHDQVHHHLNSLHPPISIVNERSHHTCTVRWPTRVIHFNAAFTAEFQLRLPTSTSNFSFGLPHFQLLLRTTPLPTSTSDFRLLLRTSDFYFGRPN